MSRTNKITATLAGTLAALALGGSTAGAMPIQAPHEYDAGHASVAQASAAAQSLAQEQTQTQAAAQSPHAALADLRSPDTREAAINSGTAKQPVLQGAPQFSGTNVTALHSTQPVKDDGDDVPLVGILLGLAGAALLGVGAAFAVSKTTRSRRARAVA